MGHASVRTRLDVYGSVPPTVDEHVSSGLGDLLRDSRGLLAASLPIDGNDARRKEL